MTENADKSKAKGNDDEEEEEEGYTYGKCCNGYAACIVWCCKVKLLT